MGQETVSGTRRTIVERTPTHIRELDQVLRGGIPKGNLVLLSGGSGMGKTTLALEFLAEGARHSKENGLFISVTEPLNQLVRNALQFRFMEPEFIDEEKVVMVDLRAIAQRMGLSPGDVYDFEDAQTLVEVIQGIVQEYKITRLVIDSVTAICQRMEEKSRIREFLFRLGLALSEEGCTTLLISETPPRELKYSIFGVEEFISDGIIFLSEVERQNGLVRTLQVIKMRGTEHSRSKFMMDITDSGIRLAPLLGRPALGDG